MTRRPASPSTPSHQSQAGQATVEFALVLPVIVLLLAGVVQIARLSALQIAVVNAARSGARAAAINETSGAVTNTVRSNLQGMNPTVHVRRTGDIPNSVEVNVRVDVTALPAIGWTTVSLHASSTMPLEDDRG